MVCSSYQIDATIISKRFQNHPNMIINSSQHYLKFLPNLSRIHPSMILKSPQSEINIIPTLLKSHLTNIKKSSQPNLLTNRPTNNKLGTDWPAGQTAGTGWTGQYLPVPARTGRLGASNNLDFYTCWVE